MLEASDSAVAVLGDDTLKRIAQELVETVKHNAKIDWSPRESARVRMRVMVKRLPRKNGNQPDRQERATALVMARAEVESARCTVAVGVRVGARDRWSFLLGYAVDHGHDSTGPLREAHEPRSRGRGLRR